MTTRLGARRRSRSHLLLCFAVSASILVAVTGTALRASEEWKAPARAARKANPIAADESAVAAGKQVYVDNCLSCHGAKGKGDGPQAKDLEVPAGNLSDPMLWQHSDGELFWQISEGKKPMPSFVQLLTEEQRWQVVHYVRTLAPRPKAD